MHFHHRHDIAGCCDHHGDWPDWATTILATLDRMEIQIMANVQDSIDAAVTVIGELSDRIKVLEAASQPPADTTALDAAVAAAQAELPTPAPAPEPAPVVEPAPADPPVADPAPVDAQPAVPSVPLA